MIAEEKINTAVSCARAIWCICMIICTGITFAFLPSWYVIFIIPFGVVTYFGMLTLTSMYLSTIIAADDFNAAQSQRLKELKEKLDDGTLKPGPEFFSLLHAAGLDNIAPIRSVSTDVIGTIDGNPIFEWIEIEDKKTHELQRFVYYCPANASGILPEEFGKDFASVNGVVYVRDSK